MSYDVYLVINTGIEEREVVNAGNYTYNVAPMFTKAMGIELSELDSKKCSEVIPILRKGILEMEENPTIYKRLNPENNWGDYDSALKFLKDIYKNCVENPKCRIKVS